MVIRFKSLALTSLSYPAFFTLVWLTLVPDQMQIKQMQITCRSNIYLALIHMLVFIKKLPDKQIELKSYEQNAESSWSHSSFCSPCYHKAATAFLFLSSLVYQGNRNKQLASLADSCINHWF